MKNHLLLFSVILYIFVLTPLLQATDVTGDNLILTGDADIAGSNLSLGTSGSDPGLTFSHNNTTATISITSSQEAAKWEWKRTPSGGAVISMRLDASNQLILYNLAGTTAGITLNPVGTSAFVNGITIGGSAVLTSAVAASTYLTPTTADSTYLRKDSTNISVGGSNTLGNSLSNAIGNSNSVTGYYAYALGYANSIAGNAALAIGRNNTVSGDGAVALGEYNKANFSDAFAVGYHTEASFAASVAMGIYTKATGAMATSMGNYTIAQSLGSLAIGQYNIAQGSTSSWVDTDDAFTIGNGTADNARSNAFVVKKNGDTTVNGGIRAVTDAVSGYGVTIGTGTNSDGGNLRLLSSTNHWNMDNYAGSLRFFTETDYGSGGSVKATLGATGNLTVNGTDNRLPNQTLADDTSILTRSLADVRYLTPAIAAATYLTPSTANSTYVQKDVTTLALGTNAVVSGTSAFAIGNGATSTNTYALAIGFNSRASGISSTAIGPGSSASAIAAIAIGPSAVASGTGSVAIGPSAIASGGGVALGNNTSSGLYATAMGYLNTADGILSTAMGTDTRASGILSTTMGSGTRAQGMNQVVLGRYNVPQGNTNTWVSTDDLFVIGNGTSDTSRTNAFVVKKNGEVTSTGKITAPTANFSGAVRIAPQGDISMGEFTAEP
jgi:hypothetical protein